MPAAHRRRVRLAALRTLDALALAGLAASALGTPAAWAGEAAPSVSVPCAFRPGAGDSNAFECALSPAASTERFLFRATFSGGHDDTEAALTASIGGAPVPCDPGSKTRLQGEDGEVSLECRLTLDPGAAAAAPVLGFRLVWSHAQFVGAELRRALP